MLRFFVILIALAISTSANAQDRVYDGCIGRCEGTLDDLEFYNSPGGIKPNVEIKSQNMAVFNQLFANSKILHSDHVFLNKTAEEIHRYNILLKGKNGKKTVLFYGGCKLRFKQLSHRFLNGTCYMHEGENTHGIAELLKENFPDE